MESRKLKLTCYVVLLFLSVAAALSITANLYTEEQQCYNYGIGEGETCYKTWKILDLETGIPLYINHEVTSLHNSSFLYPKDIFLKETDLVNRD